MSEATPGPAGAGTGEWLSIELEELAGLIAVRTGAWNPDGARGAERQRGQERAVSRDQRGRLRLAGHQLGWVAEILAAPLTTLQPKEGTSS